MDRPLLPEIEPYVNRSLFSHHFLDKLLPDDESWADDEDKVRLAMQATLNLYAPRKEELPHLNEAQLEQEFVRPMLESLGQVFQVQPSLPTSEGVRRPDYAFFATREDKRQARKHKGKLDYFKKAIAIGDAKQWGRPLDKGQRRGTDKFDMLSPSWQIDYYLRTSEVPWAILTDGRFWRLCNRETSFRLDVYYEIDLPQILAARDIEAFKYFYLFFRRQAFVRDLEGLCFLDRVYQGSLEYAREVGDGLKDSVYKALRILAEGFVQTPGNNLDPSRDLEAIHANALICLYRLLFINYAEDRRLLPRDTRLYKETYGLVSMEGEIASKLERQESLSPLQATYWEKLHVLFDLINRGSEPFGIDRDTLFVPPYNGGLFDPQYHPFLEENRVADRWLAQVMDLLARSKGEGVGRAFVDYSSLDVRHLGSIYEGLLEYKLRVADEEMVAIRRRGREEWVSASEAEGKKALERVQPSQVYLATDRGERKATGSYYTPEYVVKYIVENTLGPLIAEKKKDEDPIQAILSLKVLDPAMGSGHFLVEATDSLAHALVQALGGSEEEPEEDDIRWARREVVERCIYGVDLNPLAVELAKLSLWLHTVAEGKPLNFLDHHLKVGNSLIGAWVGDLGSLPTKRKRVRLTDREEISARQMNLLEQRLNEKLPVMLGKVLEISERPSETLEDIRGKEAADQAIEELKAPFKAVADLWVSTYFGHEVRPAEYDEALQHIGEPKQLLALPAAKRASEIAEDKRFFHWELEFPEVFYEDSEGQQNPGFDAVVGNPPYVNIKRQPEDAIRYFRSTMHTSVGRADVAVLFMEKGLALLAAGGNFSMITTNRFMHSEYGKEVRKLIKDRSVIRRLLDLGDSQVFPEITTYTCIMVLQRKPCGKEGASAVYVILGGLEPERLRQSFQAGIDERSPTFRWAPQGAFGDHKWTRRTLVPDQVAMRLEMTPTVPLSQLCLAIREATASGADDVFLVSEDTIQTYALETATLLPTIRGTQVKRYEAVSDTEWTIYPYDEQGQLLDLREYPGLQRYLREWRHVLQARYCVAKGGKKRYEYHDPAVETVVDGPKLVTPDISDRNNFTLYRQRIAFKNTVYVLLVDPHQANPLALLALLNSKLLTHLFRQVSPFLRGGWYRYKTKFLEIIPIRRISFATPQKERAHLVKEGKGLLGSARDRLCVDSSQDLYTTFLESELGRWMTARLQAKPEYSDVIQDLLAYLAEQMIAMHKEKRAEANGFLDWLAGYTGLPIEEWRLKTIVKAYWEHGWDEVRRALRQNRKAIEQASGRNVEGREALEAIQGEFEQSVARLEPLLERIAATDRLIDLIVYRLYGLTEAEVAIVEESVRRK